MQYYNSYRSLYTRTQADEQFLTVNLSGSSSSANPASRKTKSSIQTASLKVETQPENPSFYTKEIDSKTFAGQEFAFSSPIKTGNIICIKVLKDGVCFTTTTVFDGIEQNVAIVISGGADNSSDFYTTCTINSTTISFGQILDKNGTPSSELESLFSGVVVSVLRFSFS